MPAQPPASPHPDRADLATLVEDMRHWGASIALVEHRGIRRYPITYAELATLAARFAALLEQQHIGPGERVLLWGHNSAAWIAAFFGCVLRGVLPVPLDATGSVDFARRILAETTPRLLVADASLLALLNAPEPGLPALDLPSQLPLDTLAANLPAHEAAAVPLTPDTPLQILFTSGTTGEPKGVVQTHRNLLASLSPIEREIRKYRRYERWVHPLRFLHTLPLSHVFGQFMGLWVPPLLGATVHYEPRLQAARLLALLPRERIHVLAAVPRTLSLMRAHLLTTVPTLASALEAAAGEPWQRRWWRFRRIHRQLGFRFWAAVCGGATLPPELEQFWTTLGFGLIQGYGLTETAALVTLNHPFKVARGSLGKPLPGRSLRLNAAGELEVRGDMVATSRWQGGRIVPASASSTQAVAPGRASARAGDEPAGMPAPSADPAPSEYWLPTGDLARIDPSGEVRFLGRTGQRLVTAAGLNVYLQDLEDVLVRESGIHEALVFRLALPSASAGAAPAEDEAAAVLVVPAGPQAAAAAIDAVNTKLAAHQQIRHWWLWPALGLPRTATGKVQRRTVEAWALEQASLPRTFEHQPSAHQAFQNQSNQPQSFQSQPSLSQTMEGQFGARPAATASAQPDAAVRLLLSLALRPPAQPSAWDDAATLDGAWGLDSMGRVALAAALEDQLGLALPESAPLRTLGELRQLLGATPRAAVPHMTVQPAPAAGKGQATSPLSHSPTSTTPGAPRLASETWVPHSPHSPHPAMSAPTPAPLPLPYRYPAWPWWPVVATARSCFVEAVLRPLVFLLAAPTVHRRATPPETTTTPMLLICNHRTAMDLPLLLYALPRSLRRRVAVAMSGEMLAAWQGSWGPLAAELRPHRRWWGPPVALLLTTLFNVFPLPRTSGFRASFAHAGRALDRGYHVLVFPEGRRAPASAPLPFRPGLGILAQEAEAPILPLALRIRDVAAAAPRQGWFRSRPEIHIGTPIDLAGPTHPVAPPEAITTRLEAAVRALLT
ncbi:AMP-binding protein [Acidipila sp. EB88]|uniref:AMP-binding protein n=1 Tax=Acidipila sp. EB88 TaxID=2305226 RepID=UPI000F5DB579|nr:AMP-binding protein [Acidipila sp. EB88]RRA47793.1 AMP-binding protein [Acidipila sp. EB88]